MVFFFRFGFGRRFQQTYSRYTLSVRTHLTHRQNARYVFAYTLVVKTERAFTVRMHIHTHTSIILDT